MDFALDEILVLKATFKGRTRRLTTRKAHGLSMASLDQQLRELLSIPAHPPPSLAPAPALSESIPADAPSSAAAPLAAPALTSTSSGPTHAQLHDGEPVGDEAASAGPGVALVLTYTDVEGDCIALVDDRDLRDAIFLQKLNPLRIHVDLPEQPTTPPEAPPPGAASRDAGKQQQPPGVLSTPGEGNPPGAGGADDAAKGECQGSVHMYFRAVGVELRETCRASGRTLEASVAKLCSMVSSAVASRSSLLLELRFDADQASSAAAAAPLPPPAAAAGGVGAVAAAGGASVRLLGAPLSGAGAGVGALAMNGHASGVGLSGMPDGLGLLRDGAALDEQKQAVGPGAAQAAPPQQVQGGLAHSPLKYEGGAGGGAAAPLGRVPSSTTDGDGELISGPAPGGPYLRTVCSACKMSPIVGPRYQSLLKPEYELCYSCFSVHGLEGNYQKIPADAGAVAAMVAQAPSGASSGRLLVGGRSGVLPGKGPGGDVVSMGAMGDVSPSAVASPGSLPVHEGIECDLCRMHPIVGPRYKSTMLADFDLCRGCYNREAERHLYEEILNPVEPSPGRG